jgi:transposase
MANHLKMALVESILTLHQRGWSQRRIARELGVDRQTVARQLRQAGVLANAANAPLGSAAAELDSKPANAPLGSEGFAAGAAAAAKPANAPLGSEGQNPSGAALRAATDTEANHVGAEAVLNPSSRRGLGRRSDCEAWHTLILAKLEQGLSAQRIYQDLVSDHAFPGSYYSVRRFVSRLEHQTELPFRRLECNPGEEAQVDFGTGAPLHTATGRRRCHVFRIVLSYSRKAYSEAVCRQTTDNFLRCLENAFWHFGGVPERVVLDNLRAAVHKADWFEPELNPKVRAFAAHYGTVFWPTRPYTPRHKGKVERGVGYVQDNALKGRTFTSLEEQNRFLEHWEQSVADTRVHGTTRQQVGKAFAEVERPALLPLPPARFANFQEGQRTVHRDGHVEVAKAYYSVPPEYLGRCVWVRWDGRLVRVFNTQLEQIAVHVQHEPGRFSTLAQHVVSEKISSIERGAAWLLTRVRLLGPCSTRWAEAVLAGRGVEGVRVLQGLLSLAQRHTATQIERACDIAHSYGCCRLRTVRKLIDRDAPQQQLLDFMHEHPLIRPLSEYGQFIHDAFQKEVLS